MDMEVASPLFTPNVLPLLRSIFAHLDGLTVLVVVDIRVRIVPLGPVANDAVLSAVDASAGLRLHVDVAVEALLASEIGTRSPLRRLWPVKLASPSSSTRATADSARLPLRPFTVPALTTFSRIGSGESGRLGGREFGGRGGRFAPMSRERSGATILAPIAFCAIASPSVGTRFVANAASILITTVGTIIARMRGGVGCGTRSRYRSGCRSRSCSRSSGHGHALVSGVGLGATL